MALEGLSGSLKVVKGKVYYENVFFSNWFLLALPLMCFRCTRAWAFMNRWSCHPHGNLCCGKHCCAVVGQVLPSPTLRGTPLASQGPSLALAALNTQQFHWRWGRNLHFWCRVSLSVAKVSAKGSDGIRGARRALPGLHNLMCIKDEDVCSSELLRWDPLCWPPLDLT